MVTYHGYTFFPTLWTIPFKVSMIGNQSNHSHLFLGQAVIHDYFLLLQIYLIYTFSHVFISAKILGSKSKRGYLFSGRGTFKRNHI